MFQKLYSPRNNKQRSLSASYVLGKGFPHSFSKVLLRDVNLKMDGRDDVVRVVNPHAKIHSHVRAGFFESTVYCVSKCFHGG